MPFLKEYQQYEPKPLYGFSNLGELWGALTDSAKPWFFMQRHAGNYHSIGWWEIYSYTGAAVATSLLILAVLGVFFKKIRPSLTPAFLVIGLVFLVWSLSDYYFMFYELGIPGLKTQRHTTRFLLMAIAFISLFSTQTASSLLDHLSQKLKLRKMDLYLLEFIIIMLGLAVYYNFSTANKQWRYFVNDKYYMVDRSITYDEIYASMLEGYKPPDFELAGNNRGKISRMYFSPNLSKFEVNLAQNAILVFPGLKFDKNRHILAPSMGEITNLDGKLAVALPQGQYVFELKYSNRNFTTGCIISLVSAMALIYLFFFA